MTYGVLCFALLFSVVGTILGGIWANESWGRFWGWDPKENGALLICLSQLAILHARMGGFLKPFGVAMAAIVAGCVVAFSWWGVNLLGVGLHSYGFTGGILTALLGLLRASSSRSSASASRRSCSDARTAPPPRSRRPRRPRSRRRSRSRARSRGAREVGAPTVTGRDRRDSAGPSNGRMPARPARAPSPVS